MGGIEEKKLKKALREYGAPSPLPEKRNMTKALALAEMKKKPLIQEKPRLQRLWEQAAYISPITWAMQGALVLYLLSVAGRGAGFLPVSIMMPLLGIIGACELIRSYGNDMWELEMACRYNLRSIFALKLLILGSADLIILIMAASICGRGELDFARTVLLVLVPFNLSNSLYLWMIVKLHRKCTSYLLVGTGIFLSVAANGLNAIARAKFFSTLMASNTISAVLLALSLVLLIIMGMLLLRRSGKGDKKWNYI